MKKGKIIGQKNLLSAFTKMLNQLKSGRGGVFAVSGETGMGKTYVLKHLYNESQSNSDIKSVFVENQAPINDFKVGDIQPLLPFSKVVRDMMEKGTSAQKKLALNIGMTTLASLPLIGDIFYAVKEYGRDWRQYKKEKSSKSTKDMNSTAADFYDTLVGLSEKQPLILFFDNMHFADKLSIELLDKLIENIKDLHLVIVFSYQPTLMVEGLNNLVLKFKNEKENTAVQFIELGLVPKDDIREYCKIYLDSYVPNSNFDEWLYKKTNGIPGLLASYLQHFQKNSPFDENGRLKDSFDNDESFPDSVNNVVSYSLKDLTEEEINILSICASEGIEFSAYLISNLLNKDIVSTIQILRRIQNNNFVIKSIGAKSKYGVKTTVYEFTQAYFHKYFEEMLEYEERISIHGQIAAFLKAKLEETDNTNMKNELAPFVAAHSLASGDEKTAKEMLIMSAKAANEIDGREIIETAYEVFQNISTKNSAEGENSDALIFKELLDQTYMHMPDIDKIKNGADSQENGQQSYPIDFNYVRRTIVDEYHNGNLDKSLELAKTYLETHEKTLKPSESSQLLAIIARCYIVLGRIDFAKEYLESSYDLLKDYKEPIPECFTLNVDAILDLESDEVDAAFTKLQKAAKLSINLPPEIRLITISNIAILLRKIDNDKSEKYLNAVRKLARQLNYEELAYDVFKS